MKSMRLNELSKISNAVLTKNVAEDDKEHQTKITKPPYPSTDEQHLKFVKSWCKKQGSQECFKLSNAVITTKNKRG